MVKNSNKAQQEEQYKDYLRFRNENDSLRIQEQGKMDKIIFSCSIGLIGVGFGFVGIIFEKQAIYWFLFSLSILFACLSIIANYYSSWCSVQDIRISNDKLDYKYLNNENIYTEIKTSYTKWINILNNFAMFFLIIGILLFFCFVYVNIHSRIIYIEDSMMVDEKIICEGCEKNQPTKAPKVQTNKLENSLIIKGVDKNKPTLPRNDTTNNTGKK